MEIKTNQELKYIIDFYNLPCVPIYNQGKNVGEITKDMKYERGSRYYLNDENYAFQLAFEQVDRVVNLQERINRPFEAIDLYCEDKDTWVYPDVEGGTPCHHVYPKTIHTEKECVRKGMMDDVFVAHYKANNSLRYCNGCSYKFKDSEVDELYYLWLAVMPKSRSFNLYYGDGIVD